MELIKKLIRAIALWAFHDDFEELRRRLYKVTREIVHAEDIACTALDDAGKATKDAAYVRDIALRALITAEKAEHLASRALVAADNAEHRAQCITAIDVPVMQGRGLLTLTAIVDGKSIVRAFVIPPMTPSGVRDLVTLVEDRYGVIDLVDMPHGMPALQEFLRL